MLKKMITLASCVAILGAASTATAAITAAEAERLGKDLTPLGAEKAGNADGAIPAWEGGLTTPFAGWPNDDNYRPNPYADDKAQFTITAQNMDQYADKLPEAAKAMFKAYPETFKMNVYPTRRTAGYPQWYYDNIKKSATTAKLVKDGNAVEGVWAAIPFPIPQNGQEAIWNHMLRFQGVNRDAVMRENIVYSNGSRWNLFSDTQIHFPYYDKAIAQEEADNVLFKFALTVKEPARNAGEGQLAYDSLDPVAEPRKAWLYDPGERRVRRAPNLAFDTPERPLNVVDDYDIFSGSPERYDWKLVGKKEMYVPYNNNEINSPRRKMEETTPPEFFPADVLRYELHRVWVVEATVKADKRHVYAKRVFYIDEDSWSILASDKYDGNGNLWRIAFAYPTSAPEVPLFGGGSYVHVDLKKNGYYHASNTLETKGWELQGESPDTKYFTPSAMRRRGR